MNIIFYKCSDLSNVVNKTLTDPLNVVGDMVNSMSLTNPEFQVEYSGLDIYTIIYVPSLNRYFSVIEITYITDVMAIVKCKCDLLLTFKDEILSGVYISQQHTSGDRYVFNRNDIVKNQQQQQTLFFPNDMTDRTYVLVTATGGN